MAKEKKYLWYVLLRHSGKDPKSSEENFEVRHEIATTKENAEVMARCDLDQKYFGVGVIDSGQVYEAHGPYGKHRIVLDIRSIFHKRRLRWVLTDSELALDYRDEIQRKMCVVPYAGNLMQAARAFARNQLERCGHRNIKILDSGLVNFVYGEDNWNHRVRLIRDPLSSPE